MKRWFFLLGVVAVAWGSNLFWQTVVQTEKRFYDMGKTPLDKVFGGTTVAPTPGLDEESNATESKGAAASESKNAVVEKTPDAKHGPTKETAKSSMPKDLSRFADEKIAAFNRIVSLLKERPYEVKDPNNPFFNPILAEQQKAKLKTRIDVNKEYGYMQAVVRDQMGMLELEAREKIYDFFVYLADHWTDMDDKQLQALFHRHSQWLMGLDTGRYTKAFLDAKGKEDKISRKIVENYEKLRMHYLFFNDFLEYVATNPAILQYRSFMSLFRLEIIIDKINEIPLFAKINTGLRHFHTDMGRLSIFLLIMLVAWGAAYFFYYKLYAFLRRHIEAEYHETDEMMLSNLDGMRRPFFILVIAFGFRLGLEVLFHPMPLPENLALFFYAVILATVAYVIIVIIDSIFFDYLVKKGELQNKQLRQELVNLILSIIKVIIVIVALSMLLVRMGVNITGLVASLGIGGLAVALAAQNTLSNFFGLLKIIFDNSFSQGDWIETKEVEGTVVEIGFISTMIRTFDNALITVPNASLANTPLKNWSKRTVGRRIKMQLGVTYGSDRKALMAAVEEIERMLLEHPGIAAPQKLDTKEILPRHRRESKLVSWEDKYGVKSTLLVYLDEFADSSINILVYCFSKSVVWQEWLAVKQDVLLKIWEILERHGLSFAFPSESIYFDPDNIEESWRRIGHKNT